MVKDGRLVYLSEKASESNYWNIPIANTSVIILGTGTSVTHAAVRLIASAGVLFGFSGTDGSPLISGVEVEWITPQSEYRPTDYVQKWLAFWYDDKKRLLIAKEFQKNRLEFIGKIWQKEKDFHEANIHIDDFQIEKALKRYESTIQSAKSVEELLTLEAQLTKQIYKYVATQTGFIDFTRERDTDTDPANIFLTYGNYLAYGLAATSLWVLGIPHAFAVMHGKTRRGALVFDVADLIKDAIVLPMAFIHAQKGSTEQTFRSECLQAFIKYEALDYMFDKLKAATEFPFQKDVT